MHNSLLFTTRLETALLVMGPATWTKWRHRRTSPDSLPKKSPMNQSGPCTFLECTAESINLWSLFTAMRNSQQPTSPRFWAAGLLFCFEQRHCWSICVVWDFQSPCIPKTEHLAADQSDQRCEASVSSCWCLACVGAGRVIFTGCLLLQKKLDLFQKLNSLPRSFSLHATCCRYEMRCRHCIRSIKWASWAAGSV